MTAAQYVCVIQAISAELDVIGTRGLAEFEQSEEQSAYSAGAGYAGIGMDDLEQEAELADFDLTKQLADFDLEDAAELEDIDLIGP
jgi:hypothetical protein